MFFGTFINIIIYNILSFYAFRNAGKNKVNKLAITIIWLIILIFCIYPVFSGDWLHYKEKIIDYFYYHETDLEPIYASIIDYTGLNYFAFRLIIWGSALFFLNLLFSRFKIYKTRILFIFIIWGLLLYSYPRVSLGLSILFYGYSLIIKPLNNRRLISYVLGGGLIIVSCCFHKSIISLVLILPFTLVPITKKLVCIFILGGFLGVYFINNYVLSNFLSNADITIVGSNYFFKQAISISLGQQIVDVAVRLPIIAISIIVANKVLKNKKLHLDSYIYKFLSYLILILLLSFMFFFSNISNLTLFYRTLYMSLIPLSIILAALYKTYLHNTIRSWSFIAYIGENIWLLYALLGHYNGSIQ